MPYPVRYSTRAYIEYEEILDYVFKHFGAGIAFKVDLHFEKVTDNIAINPFLYPVSDKKKNLRRCVISPQTTLYYRLMENILSWPVLGETEWTQKHLIYRNPPSFEDFYKRIKEILETTRTRIYQTVNFEMVQANWDIGRIIVDVFMTTLSFNT